MVNTARAGLVEAFAKAVTVAITLIKLDLAGQRGVCCLGRTIGSKQVVATRLGGAMHIAWQNQAGLATAGADAGI